MGRTGPAVDLVLPGNHYVVSRYWMLRTKISGLSIFSLAGDTFKYKDHSMGGGSYNSALLMRYGDA